MRQLLTRVFYRTEGRYDPAGSLYIPIVISVIG